MLQNPKNLVDVYLKGWSIYLIRPTPTPTPTPQTHTRIQNPFPTNAKSLNSQSDSQDQSPYLFYHQTKSNCSHFSLSSFSSFLNFNSILQAATMEALAGSRFYFPCVKPPTINHHQIRRTQRLMITRASIAVEQKNPETKVALVRIGTRGR